MHVNNKACYFFHRTTTQHTIISEVHKGLGHDSKAKQ